MNTPPSRVQHHSPSGPSRIPIIGRDAELRELAAVLRDNLAITIHGAPGLGKRTLARALATRVSHELGWERYDGVPPRRHRCRVVLMPPGHTVGALEMRLAEESDLRLIASSVHAPHHGIGYALAALAVPLPHHPMQSAAAGKLLVAAARQLEPNFDPRSDRQLWQQRLEATGGVPALVIAAARAVRGITALPAPEAKGDLMHGGVARLLRLAGTLPAGASVRAVCDLMADEGVEARAAWDEARAVGLLVPSPPAPARRAIVAPHHELAATDDDVRAARAWLAAKARAHVRNPSGHTWRWVDEEAGNLLALARSVHPGSTASSDAAWCGLALWLRGDEAAARQLVPRWHEVLKLDPAPPDELRGRLEIALASLDRERGQLTSAHRRTRDAMPLLPGTARGLLCLEQAHLARVAGHDALAAMHARRAMAAASDPSPLRARALTVLARALEAMRAHDEADDVIAEAVETGRAARAPSLTGHGHYHWGIIHEKRGSPEDAWLSFQEVVRLCVRHTDGELAMRARLRMARLDLLSGNTRTADQELGSLRDQVSRSATADSLAGYVLGWSGLSAMVAGDYARAQRLLRNTLPLLRRARRAHALGWFVGFVASAEAMTGELKSAHATLDAARRRFGNRPGLMRAFAIHDDWIQGRRPRTQGPRPSRPDADTLVTSVLEMIPGQDQVVCAPRLAGHS